MVIVCSVYADALGGHTEAVDPPELQDTLFNCFETL